MSFAKIYETEVGQILVKIDSAEDGESEAEVRIYFEPEGAGVCSVAYNYTDWDSAEEAFDLANEETCLSIVKEVIQKFGNLYSKGDN